MRATGFEIVEDIQTLRWQKVTSLSLGQFFPIVPHTNDLKGFEVKAIPFYVKHLARALAAQPRSNRAVKRASPGMGAAFFHPTSRIAGANWPLLECQPGGRMILSDRTIWEEMKGGRIVVDPLLEGNVQPASVDVRLDRRLLVFSKTRRSHIDVREDMTDLTQEEEMGDDDPFLLHPGRVRPGEHAGVTSSLPDDIVARLESKSSLNRLGLFINSSSGYVDPGWKGHLTFGLSNAATLPITLLLRHVHRPALVPAPYPPLHRTSTAPRR